MAVSRRYVARMVVVAIIVVLSLAIINIASRELEGLGLAPLRIPNSQALAGWFRTLSLWIAYCALGAIMYFIVGRIPASLLLLVPPCSMLLAKGAILLTVFFVLIYAIHKNSILFEEEFMGHVYIPGLKVSEFELLRKQRLLPLKGEVVVKKGDKVTPETTVARTFLPGEVQSKNVAGILSVDADLVKHYMKKGEGESFEENEIIAESKGLFGLFRTRIRAPFKGTVESISDITGQVILRAEPVPLEVKAYIPGVVKQIYPEEGVLIESWATFVQGIFGIGGERFGTLKFMAKSPNDILESDAIDETCRDHILVGGGMVTADAIRKAEKVGAKGIVVGGIEAQDLVEYLGYDIGVAITGSEDIQITVIATEGFGHIPMAQKTFEILKKYDGRGASINGATQIRAGVIRPEVVIEQEEPSSEIKQKAMAEMKGIDIGSMVRVIRVPYFGKIGKIVALPAELTQLESETRARVCEIEFNDGTRATVPRANLEMIEE